MATKGLICAAVVIAGLVGCAAPLAPRQASCSGGRCDIDISVVNCTVSAPNISNVGENNIFWNIDATSKAAGYMFPDEAVHLGVWLKSPPPSGCDDPVGVFGSPQWVNNWKFKLHNKGTRGTYCYGVQVVNMTTMPPQTCTLDPQIVNR